MAWEPETHPWIGFLSPLVVVTIRLKKASKGMLSDDAVVINVTVDTALGIGQFCVFPARLKPMQFAH